LGVGESSSEQAKATTRESAALRKALNVAFLLRATLSDVVMERT
jgi:hypothetical protein